MQWLSEYGMFVAKFATVVVILFIFISVAAAAASHMKSDMDEKIEVKPLNKRFKEMANAVQSAILDKEVFKELQKKEKKEEKEKAKEAAKKAKELAKKHEKPAQSENIAQTENAENTSENKADEEVEKRVFVLSFDGDIKASEADLLREEITSIISIAKPTDEVVVLLESPGGMVHSYGLAASQLARFREKNIPLTVCVDKVAASGGYMMACVANKIIAAPFAVIGSIGVVAQIPNFHRVLKKNDVDFEQFTAGEYKRTVTMFGETTDKDRDKMQEEINEIHELFKTFIHDYRPQLDVNQVATGETWYGKKALEMNLVDEIQTSDDYLLSLAEDSEVFEINYEIKKSLKDKIPFLMASIWESFAGRKEEMMQRNKFTYYR